MLFLDQVIIKVKAGSGGPGRISFNRERLNGGPDGGNGGRGGHIYFCGSRHIVHLGVFYNRRNITAKNGESGGKSGCSGRSGSDIIVYVPIGTILYLTNKTVEILDTKKILIAHGGRGGFGNRKLGTSTDRRPYKSIPPIPGEELEIKMQLKLIADICLIGKPNTGKSSFINLVTRTYSKVGDYEFTTLTPVIGIWNKWKLIDLPGLISGAASGRGLGNIFLAHAERCKVYLHFIDISLTSFIDDYYLISDEIQKYNLNKKYIIVVTKIDKLSKSELLLRKKQLLQISKHIIIGISNIYTKNFKCLNNAITRIINSI